MSALEQEIIEKLRLLDKEAQQRVWQQIELDASYPAMPSVIEPVVSLETWLEEATKMRQEFAAKYGQLSFNIADLINEMREERLNDILDRY